MAAKPIYPPRNHKSRKADRQASARPQTKLAAGQTDRQPTSRQTTDRLKIDRLAVKSIDEMPVS